MRFSVVICTYNRAPSLRVTLDALRWQTHPDFEVVVVNGPSDDGTAELLRERADAVRVVDSPLRRLSVSRNLGIGAAAGEIVAFIDDDAVPEPRWLEDLAAAYDGPAVGGAGGLTLDASGVRPQYRYAVCSRFGRTEFDRRPPLDAYNRPGADPFLYVQGTNCSFRRSVLAQVEGFDEDIVSVYDEAEVCSRLLDAGHELRALEGAVVHHKTLPSHVRNATGLTDPCLLVRDHVHFALRVGRGFGSQADILTSATGFVELLKDSAGVMRERGQITWAELERFLARADEGFALGLDTGLAGTRNGHAVGAADAETFRPYPVHRPSGRRLAVAFVSVDYPPKPVGGIARYTQDLARGLAAAGHEAHVVTRGDEPDERTDFEDGVWVHRFPVAARFAPELAAHPLKGTLDHLAAVRGAVRRVSERVPLDAVAGSTWMAEPLFCALDPDLRVTVTCISPMAKIAEDQPEVAAAPLTPHQVRLEEALLHAPGARLQSVSHENASVCRAVTDRPIEVVWLGVADRRADHPRRRARDGSVEILFVGRQEPRKGLDTLLAAATPLLRDHPHLRLRICGADNPYANERPGVFPEWVATHAADVADRIRFDGDVADDALFDAYADADVFCGPSRYESFGLVHVEAMMMGLPVVGCDVGGMRETIVEGETGTRVPPGDAAALGAALERLVVDPELRARQGAAGRARYEAEFTIPAAVERATAIYERMSGEPSPDGAAQPALAAVLADVCRLAPAAADTAAGTLLDPLRYPYDPEAEVRAAFASGDDGDFVDRIYTAILGRAPDPEGRAGFVGRLAGETRPDIVRVLATSDEATARGLPPGFVARLPEVDGRTLAPEIVAAGFLDDDDAFVAALDAACCGGEAGADERAAWLGAGGTRAEVARAALASPRARRRVALPELVHLDALHTEREVCDALAAAGDDRSFIAALYLMVLGRAPDEGGLAGHEATLRSGMARPVVAYAVATSPEAAARGVPAELGHRLAHALSRSSNGIGRLLGRSRSTDLAPLVLESRLTGAIQRVADTSGVEARLAEIAGTMRDERRAHEQEVAELTAQLEASRSDAAVVARKYEALALDMRDRLPAAPDTEPPTDVVDPQALRIEGMGELRLNVGCGEKPLPGYVNVDFRPLPGVDVVADATRLPFEPGSVSELATFHLIEHFREHHVATVLLPHWRSLLRPDGVLRVVTPNWAVLIEQLRTGERTFAEFKTVTFGLQDYSGDDHFALYTPETLTALLEAGGFERITVLAERRQNGMSPELEVIARPRG
ncbi:MAG: hypothetical protein QOI80_2132 [Solirubrobacteraceae bacterium]|nr:hypothetical protein [Solirubrobacteraceae bacterium]